MFNAYFTSLSLKSLFSQEEKEETKLTCRLAGALRARSQKADADRV